MHRPFLTDIHITHNHSEMSEKLLKIFFKVETTHWWWIARKRIITNLLKKYLEKKENLILDAGCGTGASILYLEQFGKVYGVDLSPMAVKFCKKRGIKNVTNADVSSLPYKNNFFDLICLMDVIEHIKNDKLVIDEMYRVLKPGGILLMTVPALPFIYSQHDKQQGHYRRYSKKKLRRLFKKNIFKEEKITHFNLLLSFPIIIIRLLSRIFPKLADFDSKLNYDISKKKNVNSTLTEIFSLESNLLYFFNLPTGISLLTIQKKIKK